MSKSILLIFLGLSFLTFRHQPLSGQTLSGTYTIGTADGTEDYSTISAALADLRAGTITGNIIYQVAMGTYHETIDLSSLNNGDYTITLSGVNQELTIIHPLDSIITDKSGISLANTNHVVLQNFTLEMDDISATKVDFDLNETKGINVTGASDITLKDLTLTNDKFITSEGYEEFIASAVSLVTVQNISVSRSDLAGAGLLINLDDFQGVSISNSNFSQAQTHISHFRTRNTPADGLTIEGNSFKGPFPTDRAAAAVYLFGYSSDILTSSYSTDLTIEDNYVETKTAGSDDAIYGMYIQGQDDALIKSNVVEEGSFGIYLGGSVNSKIETNEVYRTSNRGLYIQQGNQLDVINNIATSNNAPIACITSSNLRIAHNTLYADGTEPALRVFGLSGDSLVVLNNIFSVENTAAAEVIITDVTASNITIDHNLYSENSPYAFATYRLGADIGKTNGLAYNATSLNDWQTYQALYSQNAQAFAPVFAGDDDYHITDATSYRFGMAIPDIVNDIDGDERSQSNGVDVGADQYLSDECDGTNSGTSRLDDVTYELIQPSTSPIIGLDLPKGTQGENLIYDMDGDGDNDFLFFAVGPAGRYQYIAYINDGKNHFQRVDLTQDFGVSSSVSRPIIQVADFNQDGVNDIVIGGERAGNSIRDLGPTKVYFGDAKGQVHYQSEIVLPSTRGGVIQIEDFNGDGHPDIFLISAVRGKLYLNDGSGGFSEAALTGFTEAFVLDVAVSIPYNGGVDVLVEIFESGFKNVIYRYESGVFTEVMSDFRTVNTNHAIAFGEANGDGYPDLFILDSDQTLLYLNDQSGNYSLDTSNDFDDLNSQYAYTLHFTDLNNDGAAEVVFTKAFEELAVFWNDGTGNYGSHQTYEISNVGWVTIGDLNSDGFPDFVNNGTTDVLNPSVSSDEFITRMYINNQANAFEHAQFNMFPQFRNGDIQLLDANEDGHADLLVSGAWYQGTESTTELYLNDGTGEFALTSGQPFEGLEYASIALADFNGDTHEDVVLSGLNQSDEVYTKLYLGDGAGGFSQDLSNNLSGVQGASVALDANGDDHPDLLVIGNDGADDLIAELYLNNGSGTLTLHAAGLTGLKAVSVAVGDIDGDDDADLLIQGVDATNTNQTLLFTNDGAGNFTEVTDHGLDALADGKVLLFDVDGDDDLDIYLAGGGQFLIYINDGTGNYTETQSEEGPSQSTAEFGDIDLDGDLDIVESGKYGASGEPRTFVYYNNGNGNFIRESVGALHGIFDGAIALGDLDQDLDLEIMLSGAVWNQVTSASRIYRNTSGDATNNAPTVASVSLAPDNSYLDVTFSQGVYNTHGGSGALEVSDFILSVTGGSATNPTVTSVKKNDNTVEASASALVGGETTVRIFFNTTNTPDGTETLTVNPADGSSLFSVEGDAALSSQSNNTITMIDQLPPAWPSRPKLDPSTNSGVSDTDGITNQTVLKLTGTAEPLSTITVDGSYGQLGVTSADASGNWFIITDPQAEGNIQVSVTATDAAGNVSERSFPLGVNIDLTPPVASILRHTPINELHNGSNAEFLVVFDETVENVDETDFSISGAAANGAGFTYSESFFSIVFLRTVMVNNITAEGLLDLNFGEEHGITDLAGNAFEGTVQTQQGYIIDQLPPEKPVIVGISDDTGTSSNDGITNDKNIIINGIAEPHATVEVSSQFGPLRSTQVDASGDWLLDITDITLSELTTNLTAEAVDQAGNRSEMSDIFVLTPDFTAPAKPAITGISDDTGASSSDGITNDKNIIVRGTAEPHTTIEVSSQFGPVRNTQADANGDWLLDITDITLFELTTNLTAEAVDLAGNRSETSDTFVLTPDFTAPAKPVITGISDDTGASSSDGITNDKNIMVSGTAEPYTTVEVSSQFGPVRSTQADANGDWLLDITDITLFELITNLTAEAVDLAGNRSETSDVFVLTPDFTAPAKPVITSITDDTGRSNTDGITNDQNIMVSGTAEPHATVEVSSQFGPVRSTQADASGDWLLDITDITLVEISVNLSAVAIDMAGNLSETSDIFTLTPDFTAPAKPVITGITEDTGDSNSDGVTNDKNITISGRAEPGAAVEISSQFGPLRNTQADVNGDWLLDITDITLLQIVTNLTAEAVDAAGNRSVASDIFVLTPDFTSPGVVLSVENSSPDGYTITALFDETVSGLSLEEITVTNGIASNLEQINAVSYSFFISSTGGITDVHVNTDAAQDIAGNGNKLSNQLALGLPQNSTSEVFNHLNESRETEKLNLYPNPAGSILIIDLSELSAKDVDIDLYDMAGNPMFRRQGYSQQILKLDVSSWTNGMYIVQVRNGQKIIRNKVMVSK